MPKLSSEFSNMSTADFAQHAMQSRLDPRDMGPVKVRLPHAQRQLKPRGWTANRVRDLWYKDERASEPKYLEIADLEELTGLRYARQELRSVDQLIANADALVMGTDPDFSSAFATALRAFFGALDRTGTQGRGD